MKKSFYKNYDELPLVLTAGEIAAALCISRSGAYDLMKRSDFPTVCIGNRKIVPKSAFIKWLEDTAFNRYGA
ncbi:MAG: helix-turn-helix domain-containing protein [Clostridia bacterium]|nr:helix-turn-helix domain-containing protein [Clostridia bacterium]